MFYSGLLRLKITLGDRSKKKLGRLFKQMIVFLDTLMSTCTSLLASIVLHGVYLYFWTSGMISVLILYGLILRSYDVRVIQVLIISCT